MLFKLFQVKDVENTEFAFMPYRWGKEYDFNGLYECTYTGYIDTTFDLEITDTLERIFQYGNVGKFPNYNTRSISVSDIIVLGTNPFHAYYVEDFGFTEVPRKNLSYADIESWWDEN